MASSYFCPEEPRPLAVISESYRGDLKGRLPELPDWERYSLGKEYEQELFNLLHRYLELNTTDTLCYVGDTRDHLVHRLQDHFCLLKPVQTVLPGLVHYQETSQHKMLPINIAHVGAEEFFRQLVRQKETESSCRPVQFNKILVHDACRYLSQPTEFYANLLKCLAPGGILLILHRPGRLSTLPFFKEAHNRLAEHDVPYMNIVQDLYSVRQADVLWQLESVPVRVPKRKWLAMVRDQYPSNMQLMSRTEVLGGLRELTEGIFKYEGDQVEFDDCLLFVRVTCKEDPCMTGTSSLTTIRHSQPGSTPHRHNLKLRLMLPPDTVTQRTSMSLSAAQSFKFLWD